MQKAYACLQTFTLEKISLFLFVFLSLLSANNSELFAVDYLLQRKLFLPAFEKLEEIIGNDYQGEDAYALRGHILTIRGRYSDALVDYEYGIASERIWHREGESLANIYRFSWECEKANELRENIRLFGSFPLGAKLRLYFEQLQDFRYCGELLRAWDVQAEMEGLYPRAVLTHFGSAELFLDQGDIEAAYRELWLSQQFFRHFGWKDIAARIALMEGRYEEAFQLMQYIQVQRVADHSLARFMLSAILANDPMMAVYKTDMLRWSEIENPIILYLRMVAFESMGMEEDFQATKTWFEVNCDGVCQERVLWSIEKELGYRLESRL